MIEEALVVRVPVGLCRYLPAWRDMRGEHKEGWMVPLVGFVEPARSREVLAHVYLANYWTSAAVQSVFMVLTVHDAKAALWDMLRYRRKELMASVEVSGKCDPKRCQILTVALVPKFQVHGPIKVTNE